MPNLSEIARIVGVSKTTVSLYLKDSSTTRVSNETKLRIDQVVSELNYRPNVIARSLSTNSTKTISVIIPYNGPLFRSSFVNEMLSGIQTELFRKGYSLIFQPIKGEDSPLMVKNHLKDAYGYDGLILFGTRHCTLEAINNNVEQLIKAQTPFVAVNVPELQQNINQIILSTPIESNPIKYFIETGHKEILLVIGREYDPESIETLKMYKNTLEKSGIPMDSKMVIYGDFERDATRSELTNLLKQGVKFSAVYSLSDTMAIGVYEALKKHDLLIPRDVSVIGTNDSSFACTLDPPLTTVRKQMYSAGTEAAKLLLRTITTGKIGRKIWLDSELILRSSTRVLH
jgi:LacI family transcriptional regulator